MFSHIAPSRQLILTYFLSFILFTTVLLALTAPAH